MFDFTSMHTSIIISMNISKSTLLEKKEKTYYLDISKILLSQLLNLGVKQKNIEISTECSCCLKDKYYSYRAQAKTGRFVGLIMLK